MVEFQCKFNENTAKSINKRALKKFWLIYVLASVVLVVLGVLAIVFREDNADFTYGVTLIVLGGLFTPLVFLLTKFTQKKINKSMHVLSSDTSETFQFFPDRVIITLRKMRNGEDECEYESTTKAQYSYFYKVEETQDKYFLFISKVQSHVVNKADLTVGTIEELNRILFENLGQRFKTVK